MYSCIGFKKSYPVDIYIYKKDVYTWSVHKVYTFYISEETLRWPPLFPRGRQHFIHTSYKEKEKEKRKKKGRCFQKSNGHVLHPHFFQVFNWSVCPRSESCGRTGRARTGAGCACTVKKKRILPMLKSKAPQTQNTSEKHKRALTVRRGSPRQSGAGPPGLTADTPARPR